MYQEEIKLTNTFFDSSKKTSSGSNPTERFSVIPNHVLRDITDPHTLAVACYLASHNKAWIPHPKQIQNHFGFGDHVWRRVSCNLRQAGLLSVGKGGNSGGGSILRFCIWSKPSANSRDVDFPRRGFSEPRETNALKNKQEQITNNNITSNNKQEDVVVDLDFKIIEKLTSFGISIPNSKKLLSGYGKVSVSEKIKILEITLQQKREIKNQAAWIYSALRDNYKLSESITPKVKYLTPEDTLRDLKLREKITIANPVTIKNGIKDIKEILGMSKQKWD